MSEFDYVVVGAGSAGCVLANRLSADPANRVLLVEAGGESNDLMIKIPRGFAKVLGNAEKAWFFPTARYGPADSQEVWVRGRGLGGSSSINGLIYNRGTRPDWDSLAEITGNDAWAFDSIVEQYRAIEDNALGASETRGSGGPLGVSTGPVRTPLMEAMIDAGAAMGMRRVEDLNDTDEPRVGYAMATIKHGRRSSASAAFLDPVRDRPNLTVATNTIADRLLFEGDKVVGVEGRHNGSAVTFRAEREVILCLGSLQTPKLLQLSGLGPSDVLRSLGIDVRVDLENVGRRLGEHHCSTVGYRLKRNEGYNKRLSSTFGQYTSGLQYLLTRKGPLSAPSFDIVGFLKTYPDAERVDGQILMAPMTLGSRTEGIGLEKEPGLYCLGFVLRPVSEGSVNITSVDPDAMLAIETGYMESDYDRQTIVRLFRAMREYFSHEPIASRIAHETTPGPSVSSDEEIVADNLTRGGSGYHAIGTCAMGPDDRDPLDPQLRVRGVERLRVMDCSVLPTMVAGNLNGPMMAMAAKASELILADR